MRAGTVREMNLDQPGTGPLRSALQRALPSARADLERLLRIRSVSADPAAAPQLQASADETAALLRQAGLPSVEILAVDGGQPAVLGRRPGPPGAPTGLLYAHHDVQPTGDRAGWASDPFQPAERGARLFGRGAAADKAGLARHLRAPRAHGDPLPPPRSPRVSGGDVYGSAQSRGTAGALDLTEAQLRADAAMLDGVRLIGTGGLTDRLWARPAVTVIGIDAPSVAAASNTLIPAARAKVSLRVAPGEDVTRARAALAAHLEARAPWGVQVTVELCTTAAPDAARSEGPAQATIRCARAEARGSPAVDVGCGGGSIPFVTGYAEVFPAAEILITAA